MVAVVVSFSAAAVFATPAFAATKSVPATRSVTATVTIEGYDVDFTLPTNAKAGCMVCHGDADLTRLKDGKLVSYWIDPAVSDASAHATVQCTGCHLDFAFKTPHTSSAKDWQTEAKSSCQNCHLDQSSAVARGSHRAGTLPGEKVDPKAAPKPLCGDCHGSHAIGQLTDSPEGKAALRTQGRMMCGGCHEEYWDNYNDYYHGAAYKRGAADAPACWDCHEAHDTLPAKDKDSSVNERHIVETCRKCHPSADETYVKYARLVHRRDEVAEEFFLYGWISQVRDAVMSLFGA
ncbi:MAG: hypothetical protein CVU24_17140 [Betaproteobacteria bacterium HGW-Betaproteobacteria-18]|nr:MAG: hypothetical protein CVU24_17140 [Betaproteobacteria bacterium HGW-Betaproteobacteria-18]